jgi:phosphatidylglycerol---prolipoprotein diacylglyceryl transferase
MRPSLFTLFSVGFPAYFVLLVTGFLFATTIGAMWARRVGENPDVIIDLGLAMILTGVLGGRIHHVLFDGFLMDYVHLCTDPSAVSWKITAAECASASYKGAWDATAGVCHPTQTDCFAWARFWAGGLAYYGGFFASVVTAFYLLRRDRFPFWKAADMAGCVVPLGLAFGRMGCLLAGCCFGIQTDGPLGLSFPPRSPASEWQFKHGQLDSLLSPSHAVYPTQIFESAASLAIAAFCLLYVHPRKRYDGQVVLVFIALYGIARFLLEYIRSDDRGGMLGLSTSQLMGVGLVLFAAVAHKLRSEGKFALPVRAEAA